MIIQKWQKVWLEKMLKVLMKFSEMRTARKACLASANHVALAFVI
jgi:hypothetical protein